MIRATRFAVAPFHARSSEIMSELADKVALVTGSSRGLGRAIAVALGAAKVDVAVNYRKNREQADEVVAAIRKLGRRAIAIGADVSQQADVTRLVGQAKEHLGTITILVNNAGVARVEPIDAISEQDWDEMMATNLKSAFLVTKAVLPGMREAGWGRILNMSSVASQIGGIVGPHYAASKAGLIGFTHWLAAHLAKQNIAANALAPALVESDMISADLRARPDRIPIGRFGKPEELAALAVSVLGNGYITGQTININGGLYMSS
jgi:3-oxoacyl-[acyl-carrier protein] reductase